jgi:hypothetical protein
MKNINFNSLTKVFLAAFLFMMVSCERELSDEATNASFAKTAEIFTDTPIGMGTDFYFPYGPDALNPIGSKLNAWTVDNQVSYKGSASMRFDVPNSNDPEGNYAGGIFRVDGAGRDLSGYDALTFWAKASQGVTVGEIGFGEDFFPNKYITTMKNVSIGTNWKKYIIPIPDAAKLINERGMFRYATGTQGTNGSGYIFWIDELKFEKLGTIGQPRPTIANGVNKTISSFIGVTIPIADLKEIFNMPSGLDQAVFPAPDYFVFKSSNPNVATVDSKGLITVVGSGSTVITANIGGSLNATNDFVGGLNSIDSITVNSLGAFSLPPTPTRDPSKVLSIFSDSYTNVPVTYYNGFWTPGSTTGSADFSVNGNNFLNYTTFNYVGIATSNPTLNATGMTNIHFDMYIPNSVPANFDFLVSIEDWGPNQVDNGNPQDDTRQQIFVRASQVQANTWISIDAPFTLVNKNNIGLIIMENINGSSLTNFYMDNIYFYKP